MTRLPQQIVAVRLITMIITWFDRSGSFHRSGHIEWPYVDSPGRIDSPVE